MNPAIAAAHVETLIAWAADYERNASAEGDREAAFLLRRAARLIGKSHSIDVTALPEDPKPAEDPVEESRFDVGEGPDSGV